VACAECRCAALSSRPACSAPRAPLLCPSRGLTRVVLCTNQGRAGGSDQRVQCLQLPQTAPGRAANKAWPVAAAREAWSVSAARRAEGNRRELRPPNPTGMGGPRLHFRSSGPMWQGQDSNLCRQCRRFYSRSAITPRVPLHPLLVPTIALTCANGLSTASAVPGRPSQLQAVPCGRASGGGKSEGIRPPPYRRPWLPAARVPVGQGRVITGAIK
jgi:hypothetical protein